jgi:hypothetical protein
LREPALHCTDQHGLQYISTPLIKVTGAKPWPDVEELICPACGLTINRRVIDVVPHVTQRAHSVKEQLIPVLTSYRDQPVIEETAVLDVHMWSAGTL